MRWEGYVDTDNQQPPLHDRFPLAILKFCILYCWGKLAFDLSLEPQSLERKQTKKSALRGKVFTEDPESGWAVDIH